MLSLALLSLATAAEPAQALIDSLPGASFIMRCSSTQDFIDTWGGEAFMQKIAETSDNESMGDAMSKLMESGLNLEAPVMLAAVDRGETLVASFEVVGDGGEILTKLREEQDDSELIITQEGDKVVLRGPMKDDDDDDVPFGDGANLPEVLSHVDFGERGCWAAMDVSNDKGGNPMQSFRGGVLLQGFAAHPDRFRIVVTGMPQAVAVASDVLEGEDPWRASMGSSSLEPWLVGRINLDPEGLISLLGDLPPNPRTQSLGQVAAELEESGLKIAPGIEVAMLAGGGGPKLAAVVPVRKPLFARAIPKRIAKRMAEDGLDVSREDGLTVITTEGGGQVYVAAKRRRLVVANDAMVAQEILSGGGEPWIDPSSPLGVEPGVYVDINFKNNPLTAMMGANVGTDSPLDGLERMAMSMRMDGDAAIMLVEMPGFRDIVQDGILEGLTGEDEPEPEPLEDVLGAPPSSEAAALLMLIASREDAALAETGAYVPYAGGPRALDELTSEAVPWEGIPALGIEPMDTPCRFEVSLSDNLYTGRAVCDEDGDGVQAIYLVTTGDMPFRVTPEGVR